jgi:hypothetical protein
MTLKFPEGTTLDESFQQKRVRATNGKSGSSSNLRPEDIPKGVLIIPSGKEEKTYGEPGWAVSDPKLKSIAQDDTGKITRYEFSMRLFCSAEARGANPHFSECSVNVEVCYKSSEKR